MANLQTRVVNILKSPAAEWPVIAAESTDAGRLYREYIIPLSAIGPVATFVGLTLVGASVPMIGYYRRPFGAGLSAMLVSYVFVLASVYISAMVIEWLAPKFRSSGTRIDALKLVAYAATPGWVAGALNVLPALGVLILFAMLYGIYVFYLGLPLIMKTPADQVVPYMIVSAVVIFGVSMLLGAFATAMTVGNAIAYGTAF
jgi:hypothetical protein